MKYSLVVFVLSLSLVFATDLNHNTSQTRYLNSSQAIDNSTGTNLTQQSNASTSSSNQTYNQSTDNETSLSNATSTVTAKSAGGGKSPTFWLIIGLIPVSVIVILLISAWCTARYMNSTFKTALTMILCCNCAAHDRCKCSCCGADEEKNNTEEDEEANNESQSQNKEPSNSNIQNIQSTNATIQSSMIKQSQQQKSRSAGASQPRAVNETPKQQQITSSAKETHQQLQQESEADQNEQNYIDELRRRGANAENESVKMDFQVAMSQRKITQGFRRKAEDDFDFIANEIPSQDLNRQKVLIDSLESKEESLELSEEVHEPARAFRQSLMQYQIDLDRLAQSLMQQQINKDRVQPKQYQVPKKFIGQMKPSNRDLEAFEGGVSSSFDLIRNHISTEMRENREEIQQEIDNAEPMYIPKKDRRIMPPIPAIQLLDVRSFGLGLYDNYRRPKHNSLRAAPNQFYDNLYEFEPTHNLQHHESQAAYMDHRADPFNLNHYQFSHQFDNYINSHMLRQQRQFNDEYSFQNQKRGRYPPAQQQSTYLDYPVYY